MTPLPYPVVSQTERDAYETLYDAQNEDEALPGTLVFESLGYATAPIELVVIHGKTLAELHAMLKNSMRKTKISLPPKSDNLAKDSICHHCKEVGHWRRNYLSFHVELKERKNAGEASNSDNVFYFNAIPHDDIYEIDMHNLYPNGSSNFNVSNKRAKYGLDSYYLWHYHLGHINKKRMDMLQRDGLLQPTNYESHEKCKSCISGKMARKLFPHQVERAKDLLGLIHTDVFQNEVENQPGKKIKAIRSKKEGEYLSHEFVNHMKSYARILNMVSTKKVDRTPYEIWHGKPPKLSYLRVWGCYPKETMSYYFYYPLENKIFVLRNVEFFEKIFMVQEASGSHGLFEEHDEVAPMEVEQQNVRVPIRRSARIPQAPNRYNPESDKWLKAMNMEMQSMKDNQVWILVELPPNGRTVGSKWLFKKKTDMDGNVHTFKARLVAKGYTQTYGVDYGETFSPVADIRAIRILLAIAAFYNYEIWKMDVKTSFLNGHLSEDIYMVQPEGFVDPKHPNKVCKLQRSIYGLKHASRSWNKRFDEEIRRIGFTQNPDEPCVYLKASGSNVAFLVLYVDDILLMGNHVAMLQEVKSWLCKCFSMKNLGEAAYILGIKIIRDRSKRLIALSQSAYLEKILKKFRMENSKKGYTLMMEKPDYRKSHGAKTPTEVQRMQRVPYASAIGSIMYAVRCTRPDVAFAQNLCICFQQNPGEIHWTAVKNILKYLRNTKDMVLVYEAKPEDELKVSCYADASFQTDKDDTKSQTGYVFVLNGGAVDWKSAKQSTTAMSSTEAEYIAAAEASMEAVWMRKFIDGLGGVMSSNKRPMEMLCDNEPALAIAGDPAILKGARHFQRKYHYIREVIQRGEIVLKKVHTDDNVVDPFTKPMSFSKHFEHAMKIGIVNASSLM
ncbi:putative RNA-directed DNA polymerase [Tanacetum coccineum]